MVNTYTLPFSTLNRLPGVSGIQDVTIEIPEVDDIVTEIDETLPDLEEIRTAVREEVDALDTSFDLTQDAVDRIVDQVVQEIEQAAGIDFPTVDEIAEAVGDRVDIPDLSNIQVDVGGSLFDVEDDFVDLLALALDQVDFIDVSEFPSLTELEETLQDALQPLEDIEVPDIPDIQDAAEEAVRAVIQDVPGGTLLLDPDQFIDDQIERLANRLVSDEAEAELQASVEND